MTRDQVEFEFKKKSRLPILVGGVIVLLVLAGTTYAMLERGRQKIVFGSTLKIHFEPAMAGEEKLIRFVSDEVAPDYGLKLEAVPLQDSIQANRAVADGQYAATIHEHRWWLKQVVDANGFTLTPTEPTFQWAFGVYSDNHRSVAALPQGAVIAVPSDGANQAQALWLLQRAGLISLDPKIEPRVAKLRDITGNPHGFVFKEMDLLSLPRVLDSVDAAVGYVLQFDAGKVPRSKGILFPPPPRTFASQLVVGTSYLHDPQIEKLEKAFADPRIAAYLKSTNDPQVQGVLTPVSVN